MAAFLGAQLDFIFFFYGLAFLLLGAVCFAIGRAGREGSWAILGLFGFVHGASEWLDLIALIVPDGLEFAAFRTAVMTGSYVFLMEFARQELIRLGWRMPGRWIYVPLVALVVIGGILAGVVGANAVARYALGFAGSMATGLVFVRHAEQLSGSERRLALSAALGFGLYAVAAGAIAPATPFWPAAVFNYGWFSRSTGVPIQLVRAMLACWIAFSVWAIWGQKRATDLSSARYTRYVQEHLVWTVAAMAAILVAGWVLTYQLGEIYNKNVQAEASGDLNLLASRLAGETAIADGMVKVLAGAPSVQALFTDGEVAAGQRMLELIIEASGAELGYLLDRSGMLVATSSKRETPSGGTAYATSAYFQKSIAGEAGHHFAFDAASGGRDYYASYPIRARVGEVAGVAVLKMSLEGFEANLRYYEGAYFLVDPHGVVVLSNRPELMLRTMWPLTGETQPELARQLGQLNYRPIMEREISGAGWMLVDGVRSYVGRRYVDHSQWSLMILKPPEKIYASRVLGIAITLLTTIIALIYLFTKERAIHDRVQVEKRLELQEMATDLRIRANTDPLTGLNNRLRFNEAMSIEMSRSQRYETPLSLVLYDVDHFKRINDAHGHLAGDKVLIELSRFVADQIRNVDVLARWGGEEFAILLPESDAKMACRIAQKLCDSIQGIAFDEVGKVTCSFGIAQFEHGDTAKMLVSRADMALYQAKIKDRNRVELASQHAGVQPGAESAA